jgi:hypothetical protein
MEFFACSMRTSAPKNCTANVGSSEQLTEKVAPPPFAAKIWVVIEPMGEVSCTWEAVGISGIST